MGGFFLKAKPGADPEILKRRGGGVLIWLKGGDPPGALPMDPPLKVKQIFFMLSV